MRGPARTVRKDIEALKGEADMLFAAIAALRTAREVERFFADVATPGEIEALAERLAIARRLDRGGESYRAIAASTGASTATVARVARFLRDESSQGYRLVLNRLEKRKSRS